MRHSRMRLLTSMLVTGLFAWGTASAATLAPTNTPFTLQGLVSFQPGGLLPALFPSAICLARLQGATDAVGGATITAVSVIGLGLCPFIKPANLPWTLTTPGTNRLNINGAGFNVPTVSNCGGVPYTTVVAGLQDGNPPVVTIVNDSGMQGCQLSALLSFNQHIYIAP